MIDKHKYTHYASMYLVPCYFNENTNGLAGRGLISEWFLVNFAIPFAGTIEQLCVWMNNEHDAAFPITLKGKIK